VSKIPIVSGKQVIKVFKKIGYQVVRQRGSHIRMNHTLDETKRPITIPNHKVIAKGLLARLLRDTELSLEEFVRLLRK